jgi:hypothetical protein
LSINGVIAVGGGPNKTQPVDEAAKPAGYAMSFGTALKLLKAGERLARQGWNGKGMWIYHVPAASYPAQTQAAKDNIGPLVPYGAYLAMKTAAGEVVPWLASQTDILADDWVLL